MSTANYDTRDALSYIEFKTTKVADIKAPAFVVSSDLWEVVLALDLLLRLELMVLESILSYFSHESGLLFSFDNFVLEISLVLILILNLTSNNF